MNLHFQDLIPKDFNDLSRVWIYQSNRPFSIEETMQIEETLNSFTASWKSHGSDVKGFGTLLFGHFIILMADESAAGVSGCSTDSSVRLVQNIEQDFNVSLFDRLALAFIVKERVQLLSMNDLHEALDNDIISPDTLYFNNTILTKKELLSQWIVPAKESWLSRKLMPVS